MEEVVTKRCGQCKKNKVFTEFSKNKTGKFGLHHTCRECKSAWQNLRYRRARLEVLTHYCGGELKCQCPCGCEVRKLEFLTIDHINEDGADHRRAIGEGTWTLYWWLRKHGFPPGLRVLCYNCNCGRYRNNNRCPNELGQ